MKKNKWLNVHIMQTYTTMGWEDECIEDSRREANARLREYRLNQPEYPHRVIGRRILND
jgi:hypothetical protein